MLCVALALLATCGTPEIRTPYDVTNANYKFTQTFGQLATIGGAQAIAPYVVLQMPAADDVRAFATGVVSYQADFRGMGATLILEPKTYLSSDTDFGAIEGMPRSGKLKFAIGHLDASEVEAAVLARYVAVGASDTAAALQYFMQGDGEVDVEGGETAASGTVIGKSDGGELWIVAFTGEPDSVEDFVNPLPFLAAAVSAADLDHLDAVRPQFGDAFLYAAPAADMLGAVEYAVPASGTVEEPNYLFGHFALVVEVNDWIQAADSGDQAKAVGLYELAYEINRVEGDGTRTKVHAGRNLMNEIDATSPPSYLDLYDGDRSSAGAHTFVYKLHFDPSYSDGHDPDARNYLGAGNPGSIDISGFADGTYEITLKARDARMAPGDYETKTVTATITGDATKIAQANWSMTVAVGTESTTVDGSEGTGFLIVPTATAPFDSDVYATDAPSGLIYSVVANGAAVAIADPTFAGTEASPLAYNVAAGGVHEIKVGVDQDGSGALENSEPSRTIYLMTYEVTAEIAAERKTGGGAYAAHAEGDPVALGDGLRLTLSAIGFEFGHEASATYHFETRKPDGTISIQSGSPTLTLDPLDQTGEYVITGVVMAFGRVRIENEFRQTVVGATFANVQTVCTGIVRDIPVTVGPAPMPAGLQIDYEIEAATPADGAAEFEAGGTAANGTASETLKVRGTAVSTVANNVAMVARFQGTEVGRQPLTVCSLEIIDNNNVAYADDESLQVSNYVTTNTLPAANAFADTLADPDDFRIRYIDVREVGASVDVTLEVERDVGGVPSVVVGPTVYALNQKSGNEFRPGFFLRLVSDTSDGAVPTGTADANNQTTFVKLLDTVRVTKVATTGESIVLEESVGRPIAEDDNGANHKKHDVRILSVNIVVFRDAAGLAPIATRAQVQADIDTMNERLAQSTIKLGISGLNFGGAGSPGIALPAAGTNFTTVVGPVLTADETAFFASKDGNANTVDIFYVPDFDAATVALVGNRARAYPSSFSGGSAIYRNNILMTAHRGVLSPPHEVMHLLLNMGHRGGEPATALFMGGTTLTKATAGTKRIGPYPDAAAAAVGNADTTTIRTVAQALP